MANNNARSNLTSATPAEVSAGSTSSTIGRTLRAARETQRITLRGLARRVGLSPSRLSQIECGRGMPSVGTLYNLARELYVPMDDLIRGTERAAQVRLIQRHDTRTSIRLTEGVRWERLTPEADQDLKFCLVVYGVGAESCPKDSLIRHAGRQYGYLLRGTLGARLGRDEFQLAPGCSIAFDAGRPHRFWTIGRMPAVAIWAVMSRREGANQANESDE
jgi:transcriptional regulator with XRE-family HTH domain